MEQPTQTSSRSEMVSALAPGNSQFIIPENVDGEVHFLRDTHYLLTDDLLPARTNFDHCVWNVLLGMGLMSLQTEFQPNRLVLVDQLSRPDLVLLFVETLYADLADGQQPFDPVDILTLARRVSQRQFVRITRDLRLFVRSVMAFAPAAGCPYLHNLNPRVLVTLALPRWLKLHIVVEVRNGRSGVCFDLADSVKLAPPQDRERKASMLAMPEVRCDPRRIAGAFVATGIEQVALPRDL